MARRNSIDACPNCGLGKNTWNKTCSRKKCKKTRNGKLIDKYGKPCNTCDSKNIDICIEITYCICLCHTGREEEMKVILNE